VVLDVRDDGVGFDGSAGVNGSQSARKGQGFGLRGMAQRLARVGGRLEVESAPGTGTAISASVPAIPAQAAP
jgi:signal transduction histidine kinase